jgi:uncharacterized protein
MIGRFLGLLLVILCAYQTPTNKKIPPDDYKTRIISNKWQPFRTVKTDGILRERIDLWRNKRLWFVENSGFLLAGFEKPPGTHAWQGEHVGKWLHAATLSYEQTKDDTLKNAIENTVKRLLATQLPNGYIGTYSENDRFYIASADPKGWDIWTQRYNLYGLLVYEKFHPNQNVLEACRKMADLLIDVYGSEKADITKYGTRQGISSTTILESIVMLYERTGEKKYLDFAEHLVIVSERNPGLRLMDAMLKKESVVYPGDGKAYQLMANLLGYLRLYQSTGNEKYFQTVLNAWQQIREKHILVTGGPWTRKMDYNGNKECFAKTDAFHPTEIVVENCCTVTWIQLNLHLAELTGLAKYAEEAEKALFNHFFGGQHTDGIDWCYYTKPNQTSPPYVPTIHCCASSGPRALEMFSNCLVGKINDRVSISYFSPATVALEDRYGGGNLKIKSNFPLSSSADIVFEVERPKEFILEFRLPYGSSLAKVNINGKEVRTTLNSRGYYEINNNWKKGDVLFIKMDYKLQVHVQEGESGKKWMAFSYGPIALAQKIFVNENSEPFKDVNAGTGGNSKILDMISVSEQDGSNIVFTIKNTAIELIPYYQAGSRNSGPKTYFECSK